MYSMRGGEPEGAAGSAAACDHRNRRHDDQTQGIGRRVAGKRRRTKGKTGREVKGVQMSSKEREEARGEGWSGQVRAARRAVTKAMIGGQVEEEDWKAVQQMLGEVVRRPDMVGTDSAFTP